MKTIRTLAAIAFMLAPGMANASVIGFEDLVDGQTVPNGYEGLATWSAFTVSNQGGVSFPPNFAVGDGSSFIADDGPFDLHSLWLRYSSDGLLNITGYALGVPLFNAVVPISTSWNQYTLNWSGIDHVGFGGQFFVDEIDIDVASVPEPSTLGLIGLGLLGLGAMKRRRRDS